MEAKKTLIKVVSLIITFVVVRVVRNAVGFHYDLFVEGVFTMGFVIDFLSVLVGYTIISFPLLSVFYKDTAE